MKLNNLSEMIDIIHKTHFLQMQQQKFQSRDKKEQFCSFFWPMEKRRQNFNYKVHLKYWEGGHSYRVFNVSFI